MAGFCVRAADVVMCLSWCRRTCTGALRKRRIDTLGRALAMDLVSVAVLCGSHVCTAHEPSIGAFGRSIASQSRAKGRWPDRPRRRRWLQRRAHSSSATSRTRPWASTARAVAAPAAWPTGMEMVITTNYGQRLVGGANAATSHHCVVHRSGDPTARAGLVGKVVLQRLVDKSVAACSMDIDGIPTCGYCGYHVGKRRGREQCVRAERRISLSTRCAFCAPALCRKAAASRSRWCRCQRSGCRWKV